MVGKRRRYYAPLTLIALYTMVLYLCVYFAYARYEKIRLEEIRSELALAEELWRSPAWEVLESVMLESAMAEEESLSPYDDLFIEISHTYNTDWMLMSAISYCESRFNPEVKSYGGAVGLMQMMPRTARIYGITEEQLSDPETNITVANIYFKEIERMLGLPPEVEWDDRISLILASYNGGIGRVFDAQRLARADGVDQYSWDVLKWYLLRLMQPEYYESPLVRGGKFRAARKTLMYVVLVKERYYIHRKVMEKSLKHLLYPHGGEFFAVVNYDNDTEAIAEEGITNSLGVQNE